MVQYAKVVLATKYTPAEIWNIAETSVILAARTLVGVTPSLLTPINRYIPDDASVMRYYGILQDLIDNNDGLIVDFAADPPLSLAKVRKASFIEMVYAVEERLHSLGRPA